MKVMDRQVIRSGEQELIDGITADLDWGAVERVFADKHKLRLGEEVDYKSGDLVVHDQQVAYQLEFEVKIPLSIVLDRDGNCLSIRSASPEGHWAGAPAEEHDEEDPGGEASEPFAVPGDGEDEGSGA